MRMEAGSALWRVVLVFRSFRYCRLWVAQPLQFSVRPTARKGATIIHKSHHTCVVYITTTRPKWNRRNDKCSLMLLTVCMVSGCHVGSGAAIDYCVRSQVGELSQSPQQPSSVWIQKEAAKDPSISTNLASGQQDHQSNKQEVDLPPMFLR